MDRGALTFLDLMFHTRNAPRMPRRSDAAAMQDPGRVEGRDRAGRGPPEAAHTGAEWANMWAVVVHAVWPAVCGCVSVSCCTPMNGCICTAASRLLGCSLLLGSPVVVLPCPALLWCTICPRLTQVRACRPARPPVRLPAGWQAAYEQRGWAVTALEPSAAVIEHVAFITFPPDGRYGPLGPPTASAPEQQHGKQEEQAGVVRALVFALDADLAAESAGSQLAVELEGYLPGGTRMFKVPMQQTAGSSNSSGSAAALFEAQAEVTISCEGRQGGPAGKCLPPAETVHIQVGGGCGRVGRVLAAASCAAFGVLMGQE